MYSKRSFDRTSPVSRNLNNFSKNRLNEIEDRTLIRLVNVGVEFGSLKALDSVSLNIERGDFTFITAHRELEKQLFLILFPMMLPTREVVFVEKLLKEKTYLSLEYFKIYKLLKSGQCFKTLKSATLVKYLNQKKSLIRNLMIY